MSQPRLKASTLLASKGRFRSKPVSPKRQKKNSNAKEKNPTLKKDLRRKANQGSILKAPFQMIDLWPKVDSEYFRPLSKDDKEILNTFIIDPDTGQDNQSFCFVPEFKDYENIFSESYQKVYLQDHLVSGQPLKNMDPLWMENTTSSSSPEIPNIQNFTDFEENNQQKSWLDREIENQQEILKELTSQNKQHFLDLEKQFSAETTKNSLLKIQREVERECLKNYIINLEDQQAAESLQSVNTCKQFCKTKQIIHSVNFDEALFFNEVWIDNQTLNRLDKFREILNLSIDGFKPKMALLSKSITQKTSEASKTSKTSGTKKQSLCHFCKAILTEADDELFIACRYRSSRMGPPQHDSDQSLATLYMKGETSEKDRKRAKFDKMGVLSSYQIFEGEKFCARKFCETCLRQEFDIDIRNLKNKTFWKCPFCKGMCNCSRCLRNNQIKTLLQLYLKIDGDPLLIKEQTCFGRYISQCDLKIYFKNNQTPFPDDLPEPKVPLHPRQSQINDRIGHTILTPEICAINRDKRHLNRTLSIEKELPKKRIHQEKFDRLVIAIDGESEKCFLDFQSSPEKKKPLLPKKALIKRGGTIKQHSRILKEDSPDIARSSLNDKENQPLESNKPSSAHNTISEHRQKNVLSMKNKDKADMKCSNEGLSKKELDQALWEDYCNLRALFEMSLEDDEEEKEDFSKTQKISKKKYLDVIELE